MIELICDELDIDIDSYAKEIGYEGYRVVI